MKKKIAVTVIRALIYSSLVVGAFASAAQVDGDPPPDCNIVGHCVVAQ